MREAVSGLRASGIPHAEHWGKLNQLTSQSVRDVYGADLVSWAKVRSELLGRDASFVFGSPFLDRLGITSSGS